MSKREMEDLDRRGDAAVASGKRSLAILRALGKGATK